MSISTISQHWPDLDQTLNKGSWEHLQQITTVTTTFVQATIVLGTFVHISNISISKLNTFDFSLVLYFKATQKFQAIQNLDNWEIVEKKLDMKYLGSK